MPGPLVEEVAAERHGVPDPSAEEFADGHPQDPALDVQCRDVEGREHTVGGGGARDHPAHAVAARDGVRGESTGHPEAGMQAVGEVPAHDRPGRQVQTLQVPRVPVGLAQSRDAGVGGHLQDRPQRERFVHAHGVQQGRVGERHGRHGHPRDDRLPGVEGGLRDVAVCVDEGHLGWSSPGTAVETGRRSSPR